jgi:hypothetical protein
MNSRCQPRIDFATVIEPASQRLFDARQDAGDRFDRSELLLLRWSFDSLVHHLVLVKTSIPGDCAATAPAWGKAMECRAEAGVGAKSQEQLGVFSRISSRAEWRRLFSESCVTPSFHMPPKHAYFANVRRGPPKGSKMRGLLRRLHRLNLLTINAFLSDMGIRPSVRTAAVGRPDAAGMGR